MQNLDHIKVWVMLNPWFLGLSPARTYLITKPKGLDYLLWAKQHIITLSFMSEESHRKYNRALALTRILNALTLKPLF